MTSPDRPAPGEDIAKGSDGHSDSMPDGQQPGDPDPRDPSGHTPDSMGLSAPGADDAELIEPPD